MLLGYEVNKFSILTKKKKKKKDGNYRGGKTDFKLLEIMFQVNLDQIQQNNYAEYPENQVNT